MWSSNYLGEGKYGLVDDEERCLILNNTKKVDKDIFNGQEQYRRNLNCRNQSYILSIDLLT